MGATRINTRRGTIAGFGCTVLYVMKLGEPGQPFAECVVALLESLEWTYWDGHVWRRL